MLRLCLVKNVDTYKRTEAPGLHRAFDVLIISVELKLPVYFTDTRMVFAMGEALFSVLH